MARETPLGCFKGGVYVNFKGGIGLTWFHKKCCLPGALAVPKTFKNRFSFCSIFFHVFNGMFSPSQKVEELIRPAGHALCRWRVPFCRCGPKFEQSFLTEGFLVFDFQLPGRGRGQLWPSGGAAKLSCQGRFRGTCFFLKFHVLPRNWKNNVESIFRNEWKNLRQLKQHKYI